MTADCSLRIGVALEAFLDWPLDRVLPWLREHAPEVTDLEIGTGGRQPGAAEPARLFGPGPVARIRRRRVATVCGRPGPGDLPLPRPGL